MDEKKKEKIVKFFKQMLNVYDFQLVIDINKDLEDVFRLKDIQKENLNGIEQEEFYTLADIIARLDSYHKAYVYNPLTIKQDDNVKQQKDDWILVTKRYLENDTFAKVLSEIHAKEYVDLIAKKEKFEIQDIIKILDEDFYKDYTEQPITCYDLCLEKVIEYFKEHKMKDLMDYGNDIDEGLYHLSSLYSEIMDKLNIKYTNIFTEDGVKDGDYLTTITFEDNSQIQIDTSAWNGIKLVTENMKSIYETYEKIQDKRKKNEQEFDYNYG